MAFRKKVGGSINCTDTIGLETLSFVPHIMLINDGPNSVYLILNQSPKPFYTEVDTNDFELKNGEFLNLDTLGDFESVLHICEKNKTATLRFLGWH